MDAQIDGKDVQFWVAPTAGGGFCFELETGAGGCDRDRQLPVAPGLAEHTAETTLVLFGDALGSDVDQMRAVFANGQSVLIPVVSVSAPINASFFIYPFPGVGPHLEDFPLTVQALRADGSVIASSTTPGFANVPGFGSRSIPKRGG